MHGTLIQRAAGGESGRTAYQLVAQKSNEDLRKSGPWAEFNRRKVNVKSCTLGPSANCVRWNERDAEDTNTDLFVVERCESPFKKWRGGDAIVRHGATVLVPGSQGVAASA